MRSAVVALVVFALLAFASAALAQTPVEKPTTAVFDYAAHATAARYELGYFAFPAVAGNCNFTATPGSTPTQVDDLGKPATTTGVDIVAPLVARPIGCYGAKVRALDVSGLWTDWSPMSNDFFTRPPAPVDLVVK